jgi:hypothetical protein
MSNNAKKSQASVMLVFTGPDRRRYRIVSFVGGEPSRVEKYVIDEEREDTVGDKFWHPIYSWEPRKADKLTDLLVTAILYLMNPNALMINDAELEGRKADAATIAAQPADKRGVTDGPRRVLVAGVDFSSSATHVAALPAGTRICSRCAQVDPSHTVECNAAEPITPTKLQATCRRCDLQYTHDGSLTDMTTTCPECQHGQVPNFTADAPQCDYPRCRRPREHVGNHVDQQGDPIMCSRDCGRPAGHGGKCYEAHP